MNTKVKQPIRGKVAKVLNTRELVIKVGEKKGVEGGMKFVILDPKGADIKDPDTGEVLGSIERPKINIEVTLVKDNLSVASTYKKKKVNIGGTGIAFSAITLGLSKSLMPPEWIDKHETLKTDEQTWEDLDESESFVKTGDPVAHLMYE